MEMMHRFSQNRSVGEKGARDGRWFVVQVLDEENGIKNSGLGIEKDKRINEQSLEGKSIAIGTLVDEARCPEIIALLSECVRQRYMSRTQSGGRLLAW